MQDALEIRADGYRDHPEVARAIAVCAAVVEDTGHPLAPRTSGPPPGAPSLRCSPGELWEHFKRARRRHLAPDRFVDSRCCSRASPQKPNIKRGAKSPPHPQASGRRTAKACTPSNTEALAGPPVLSRLKNNHPSDNSRFQGLWCDDPLSSVNCRAISDFRVSCRRRCGSQST